MPAIILVLHCIINHHKCIISQFPCGLSLDTGELGPLLNVSPEEVQAQYLLGLQSHLGLRTFFQAHVLLVEFSPLCLGDWGPQQLEVAAHSLSLGPSMTWWFVSPKPPGVHLLLLLFPWLLSSSTSKFFQKELISSGQVLP